jgi:hypothetical protein
MSRRFTSAMALKTSDVVDERATAASYSDIGMCQAAATIVVAPRTASRGRSEFDASTAGVTAAPAG